MRKAVTLLLAAGILLGAAAGNAGAVELRTSGTYEFGWSWSDTALERDDPTDTFRAVQRIRPQFDFVVSDNLSGTFGLEIGDGDWGSGAWGMGGDATNALKVRYAYMDWTVPGIDVSLRMGLHEAETPSYTFFTVFAETAAGISFSRDINDNVGIAGGWFRPYNTINKTHDSVDVFMLSLPVKGDGFEVNPWGMLALAGSAALGDALTAPPNNGSELDGLWSLVPVDATAAQLAAISKTRPTGWWLGIGGELSVFDPFTLAMDFVYGSFDAGDVAGYDIKRAGWMIAAQANYKLDMMTPGIIMWYASGDDSNPTNGSERLPAIFGDSWATNFGGDGGWYDAASLTTDLSGSWGVGLRLDDISFVENLSHNLRLTYYQGTNNKAMAAVAGAPAGTGYGNFYLTTKDRAWEANFETTWQIYKNLSASFELGYIKLDLDEDIWGSRSDFDDKMYKAGIYMTYKF